MRPWSYTCPSMNPVDLSQVATLHALPYFGHGVTSESTRLCHTVCGLICPSVKYSVGLICLGSSWYMTCRPMWVHVGIRLVPCEFWNTNTSRLHFSSIPSIVDQLGLNAAISYLNSVISGWNRCFGRTYPLTWHLDTSGATPKGLWRGKTFDIAQPPVTALLVILESRRGETGTCSRAELHLRRNQYESLLFAPEFL